MEYVETDSYVWFEHDTEKFIPCKVLTGGKACGLPLALALQLRAPVSGCLCALRSASARRPGRKARCRGCASSRRAAPNARRQSLLRAFRSVSFRFVRRMWSSSPSTRRTAQSFNPRARPAPGVASSRHSRSAPLAARLSAGWPAPCLRSGHVPPNARVEPAARGQHGGAGRPQRGEPWRLQATKNWRRRTLNATGQSRVTLSLR